MAEIGQPYASGRWLVNSGSEDEFIERWTTFTKWSLDNAPGTESFVLLRDSAEPRRFLSIGAFESHEAVRQWRFRPGTQNNRPVPVRVRVELTFTLR